MELVIKITDKEAEQLYHSSTKCFYHEQEERFDFLENGDEMKNIMNTFTSDDTMHWCGDSIMNAIFLKNYYKNKNFQSVILYDMVDPSSDPSYVVVSNLKWQEHLKGLHNSHLYIDEDPDDNSDNDSSENPNGGIKVEI